MDQAPGEIVSFVELSRQAMFRRFDRLSGGRAAETDELAALVYDSERSSEPVAALRSVEESAARYLTFRSAGLLLEVELDSYGRQLVCQLVPSQPARMEIRHSSGVIDLGEDDDGVFHCADLPSGSISLRCLPVGDPRPVTTSLFDGLGHYA